MYKLYEELGRQDVRAVDDLEQAQREGHKDEFRKQPEEIPLTEAFRNRFPDVPQVACFNMAFHHDMPRVAHLLPIPCRYEAQDVHHYGFHGLSYAYLMEELTRLAGTEAAQRRAECLACWVSVRIIRMDKALTIAKSLCQIPGINSLTKEVNS